jgi:hypothetical protein
MPFFARASRIFATFFGVAQIRAIRRTGSAACAAAANSEAAPNTKGSSRRIY